MTDRLPFRSPAEPDGSVTSTDRPRASNALITASMMSRARSSSVGVTRIARQRVCPISTMPLVFFLVAFAIAFCAWIMRS